MQHWNEGSLCGDTLENLQGEITSLRHTATLELRKFQQSTHQQIFQENENTPRATPKLCHNKKGQ